MFTIEARKKSCGCRKEVINFSTKRIRLSGLFICKSAWTWCWTKFATRNGMAWSKNNFLIFHFLMFDDIGLGRSEFVNSNQKCIRLGQNQLRLNILFGKLASVLNHFFRIVDCNATTNNVKCNCVEDTWTFEFFWFF